MVDDKAFLGTGWNFPPAFDLQGNKNNIGARMVSAEEDIRQSLRILLATAPGERTMHPTYGCELKRMVFQPINSNTLSEMRDFIRRAVLFFEPRITLQAVEFDTTQKVEGLVKINLIYVINLTNHRSNMVFPFYTNEATHPPAL